MRQTHVREKILSAGLETLYSKGFNATSVQDITEAAGVPKGSFYNHFESKEQLGVEVVQCYADSGAQAFEALGREFPEPRRHIEAYFRTLMARAVASGFCTGCLIGNFGAELTNQSETIRLALVEAQQIWKNQIIAKIAEAQAQGEISAATPAEMLAGFALDAWQGAVVRARIERSAQALENFLEILLTKILV